MTKTYTAETYSEDAYLQDTMAHIKYVRSLMFEFSDTLRQRAAIHDASKLVEPEKSIFREHTPALDKCEFGSDAYVRHKEKVKVALDHHYAHNSHHPEHYPNGIPDMNLYDIVEMFCDWTAASVKNNNGDVIRSIQVCKERFGISDELATILQNTVAHIKQKPD